MVSSGMGEVSCLGASLRERFLRPDLTRPELEALLEEFVAAVERGDYRAQGWPRSAYSVSKVALNALTRVLARGWNAPGRAAAPRINAVCPGWVRTDMGGRFASRGVDKGAQGIVWAATLPPDGPTGGFFRDGQAIPW
jgi:NAD(P)-dependent dehydrogenase (short-subunit alcohol dehydrogenase family)